MLRDYEGYLTQSKDPIPPRDYAAGFYVCTNTKELENNIKVQECPSESKYKVKVVVT